MKKFVLMSTLILAACANENVGANNKGGKIDPTPPVNLPPAGYTGGEFVDARGCNYIRTDFDNKINWVPRVTMNGSQICSGTTGSQYAVGGGITDIHGTLTQTASAQSRPATVSATPGTVTYVTPQVASNRATGGIQFGQLLSAMSGNLSAVDAEINGIPEEVAAAPAPGTLTVVPAPQSVAPAPTAQAAAPAPVQATAAAAPATPPAAPLPAAQGSARPLSGNVMTVMIGNESHPVSEYDVARARAAGYQVVSREGGTFIIPGANQSPMDLKRQLDQAGFGYSLVVGVAF